MMTKLTIRINPSSLFTRENPEPTFIVERKTRTHPAPFSYDRIYQDVVIESGTPCPRGKGTDHLGAHLN